MLEYIRLENVGPAPEMELELSPRLNLVTGDNGLGKSFLLDVAWWALTRKWPRDLNPRLTSGFPARPTDPKRPAKIHFKVTGKTGKVIDYESTYRPREQSWIGKAGRPWIPGLVIYAHADGGFSVWDPHRNYWNKKGDVDIQERVPGYAFAPLDVWNGLKVDVGGERKEVCKGLIDDWSVWIRERGDNAERMAELLQRLAPRGESMDIGPLLRLSVDDAQDVPSIRTPYAQAVPILHASSGIRRIAGLAYMLLWSWNEHVRAAEQLGEDRTGQVVMLFDEIESHLHPRWQRSILRSVLHIAESLHDSAAVQLVAATHSPLVLASAEPIFDPAEDAWFDLDLDLVDGDGRVVLQKRPFVRRGTAGRWLTSQAFDLPTEGRSLEAEQAIEKAEQLLERRRNGEDLPRHDVEEADEDLRAVLPDVDRFWIRWSAMADELKGVG